MHNGDSPYSFDLRADLFVSDPHLTLFNMGAWIFISHLNLSPFNEDAKAFIFYVFYPHRVEPISIPLTGLVQLNHKFTEIIPT